MSAGFKVAGEVFWGTNGAVEAYVETMAAASAVLEKLSRCSARYTASGSPGPN